MPPRNRPPAHLPAQVRDHPEVIKACQDRDIGKLFRLINNLTDGPHQFTASHIGRRCELTPSRVGDYMTGRTYATSLEVITRVADGLHIPGARFALARRPWEQTIQQTTRAPKPTSAPSNGHEAHAFPPVTVYPSEGAFRLLPVGREAINRKSADAAAMHAFRTADLQVGGGHLYASVLQYLHRDIAPKLFGAEDGPESGTVFTAAAALTEMAGWMAHDAGRDKTAKQHFGRSLSLAQIGGDHQLSAHVLGSMSHLASHRNQPHEAIAWAHQGQTVLQGAPPHPALKARLLAMEARGHAGLRDSRTSVKLLLQAEQTLDDPPAEAPSPWAARFDAGSLASEAARCMRELGDWQETARQAERVIMLRPSNRTRSRAFGQLTLVAVLMAAGKPDEACALAREVLDSTQALGSFLVIQQLLDLRDLLEPHRANKNVGEFLACMDHALQERLWLYQ